MSCILHTFTNNAVLKLAMYSWLYHMLHYVNQSYYSHWKELPKGVWHYQHMFGSIFAWKVSNNNFIYCRVLTYWPLKIDNKSIFLTIFTFLFLCFNFFLFVVTKCNIIVVESPKIHWELQPFVWNHCYSFDWDPVLIGFNRASTCIYTTCKSLICNIIICKYFVCNINTAESSFDLHKF